ncbi:spondin-1-like [Musca domestica]|uniref:Spondin-1 n=1 Tax=Musca domestica TaxID=7370 RepID=A0ABM3V1J1_MUSDO|nr:spondin-1-like [Musca domestica]
MENWKTYFLGIYIVTTIIQTGNVFAILCSRYPQNTLAPKAPVDDNFAITITGNAQTYLLGQTYNVSLQAYNGRRFISAKLALENDNGDLVMNSNLGHFELIDPVESRFSADCVNMIETTNTNPKTRLDMAWVAPSEPGFGCVLIRATVIHHRDVWFMDDGLLTKRICEEAVDDLESQKKDEEGKECCACDEARYEITFEGMWSRNLHPKDFPAKGWLAKFSDILGAAHTSDYRFWDSGELASSAMQEFAEHGSSRGLEQEFNNYFKEKKIRTILKARGPSFPYLNNPTLAWLRVDPSRHQLSLASKITPSPDWIVGVAGLELCLANCTWIEEKVISLYPWDIGTDAGPSYTSPDQPQLPPDVIRRMRSDFPSDPRSPFYDPTGAPMKPMAMLKIKRQRLYERKCTDEDSNNADDIPRECHTHPWSAWSECSAECGLGTRSRSRVYKQPEVASIYNCDEIVIKRQVEPCSGACSKSDNPPWLQEEDENGEGDNLLKSLRPMIKRGGGRSNVDCAGQWSAWSACNATCGVGFKMRRKILDARAQRECQEEDLYEYEKCFVSNVACRRFNVQPVVGATTHLENNFENPQENTLLDSEHGDNENYPLSSSVTEPEFSYERVPNSYKPIDEFAVDTNLPEYNYNNQEEDLVPSYGGIQAENLRQEPPGPYISNYHSEGFYEPEETKRFQYLRRNNQQIVLDRNRKALQYSQRNVLPGHPNLYDDTNSLLLQSIPVHCYQPLSVVECSDNRVISNYWFYNFCTDECMLYAADICDPNTNKFPSFERCEQQCANPLRRLPNFLRRKQLQSPFCQRLLRNSRKRAYTF